MQAKSGNPVTSEISSCVSSKIIVDSFYFIRHGQTDANLKELMCGGEWDIELNENGRSQALTAAQGAIAGAGIVTICCSPMLRARQTAEILNAALKVPIIIVEELREWLVGEWEGVSWASIPNPFHPGVNPPAGETRLQFEERVAKGVVQALGQDGPVLLVAHGGVFHAMCTPLGVDRTLIENCILQKVSRASSRLPWRIDRLG